MTDQDQEYNAAAAAAFKGDEAPRHNPLFAIGVDLLSEFATYRTMRREVEERWLRDLRQYKGIYDPDEEAKMRGSKAFLRKTRVKIESVDARIMDLLFPANRERNYSVDPTPEANIAPEVREEIRSLLAQAMQSEPDEETLEAALDEHAKSAAKAMETRIDDQLTEAKYRNVARDVLHSGHLYGTGILKGPLVERKERIRYVYDAKKKTHKQRADSFTTPSLACVPIWRWYPDMTVTDLKDCRSTWEHLRLSRSDLAQMADRRTFDGEAIKSYISSNPDGNIRLMDYEVELRGIKDVRAAGFLSKSSGMYDLYERWGWLSAEKLVACGVKVPADRMHESFYSNILILPDGTVVKAILAPIEGVKSPYHLYYLEKDETSIFADGYAAIMRDDQKMINAAGRMILDNAAITSGPQFEVFLPAFPAGADLTTIYPGKVWPRTGGDMQFPAVRQLDFSAHFAELLNILQLFDANADDTTAIPKYTYGDNPTGGAAATMGGLSMLMAQANIALKDLVTSFDEGVTKPFIESLYHWNMKFSRDPKIKGDFDVKARGSASLVAKEVRAQSLAVFSSTLQPEERGYIKWDKLITQKAESQDLADIIKTADEMDADANSPAGQMQQQLQQAITEAELAKRRAEVAEREARASGIIAKSIADKMDAFARAMELAPAVMANQQAATLADGLLKESGWAAPTQAQQVNPQEMPQ